MVPWIELATMHGLVTTTCYMATVYDGYEDLFLENRLECEIIAWKNITNKAINLHAIKPRTSVNLLVILVRILVNLLVKLTKLGQGGHRGRGSRDWQTQGGHVPRCVVLLLVNLFGVWPKAQGPMAPEDRSLRSYLFVRLWRHRRQKGKKRLPLYDFHRFLRLSWDEYWESCQTILLLCRSCY